MLAAASLGVLLKKLPVALDCLGEHCERHGLRVNYQPGKTEIMLHLSGKDQGILKARIAADGHRVHTPGGRQVRVLDNYVHLGSTMGDDNADVERRHNACMQSYAPIAQSVFGNCCFRMRDRVNTARSLCFSRRLFLVHVWSYLSPWAARRLNGGYMRMLRRIVVAAKIQSWSVDRCESPRVPQHARDPVLHFAKQVAHLGSARERTSRHSVKPFERELSASLGHPGQNKICCSSGPIDTTCFSRSAIRSIIRRPGRTIYRGFLISGSDSAQLDSHVISSG